MLVLLELEWGKVKVFTVLLNRNYDLSHCHLPYYNLNLLKLKVDKHQQIFAI